MRVRRSAASSARRTRCEGSRVDVAVRGSGGSCGTRGTARERVTGRISARHAAPPTHRVHTDPHRDGRHGPRGTHRAPATRSSPAPLRQGSPRPWVDARAWSPHPFGTSRGPRKALPRRSWLPMCRSLSWCSFPVVSRPRSQGPTGPALGRPCSLASLRPVRLMSARWEETPSRWVQESESVNGHLGGEACPVA